MDALTTKILDAAIPEILLEVRGKSAISADCKLSTICAVFVKKENYVTGTDNSTYAPHTTCNRVMIATFLRRAYTPQTSAAFSQKDSGRFRSNEMPRKVQFHLLTIWKKLLRCNQREVPCLSDNVPKKLQKPKKEGTDFLSRLFSTNSCPVPVRPTTLNHGGPCFAL